MNIVFPPPICHIRSNESYNERVLCKISSNRGLFSEMKHGQNEPSLTKIKKKQKTRAWDLNHACFYYGFMQPFLYKALMYLLRY